MTPACPASRSSRSARATACRTTRRAVDGRQGGLHRSADRRRPAGRSRSARSSSPQRVPQMADSEEVVRGHHAAPGTRYTALVPNLRGLARAVGGRRRRGRGLRRRLGDVQPAQHQPGDRRVARRLTARSCDEAARVGRPRAGYLSTALRLPVRGRRAAPRVAELAERAARDGRLRGGGQRHDRRRAPGPGLARAGRRGEPASRSTASRCTSTTRAAPALANVLAGLRGRRHHVRRLVRRARRLSLRARRERQPRDRGPGLHAGRAGHRDRRQPCEDLSRRRRSSSRTCRANCRPGISRPSGRRSGAAG